MAQDSKEQRIADAVRRSKRQLAVKILAVVVILAALGYALFWYVNSRGANLPGVLYPEQGREHKELGYQFTYNSNPPTSGPHYATAAEWGVYKEELPDQVLIHNLEHGGIWISYKPDISEETIRELERFYEEWGRKIIVTPRAQNEADIAVAAWGYLDTFSIAEYSKERIEKFIGAYRNKGPEFVP
ncbi:MAG: DUF3105 domain-containing protein [bacterium]|nr:DUF3105 domain-containing protein [bacterium]